MFAVFTGRFYQEGHLDSVFHSKDLAVEAIIKQGFVLDTVFTHYPLYVDKKMENWYRIDNVTVDKIRFT